MDLSRTRIEYETDGFDVADTAEDPIAQFGVWMDAAVEAAAPEPAAMVLSTVDGDGRPRGRNVLLRKFDDAGFVFFTNYGSEKAKALDETGLASLTFYWYELHRQVIVEGAVEKVSSADSDEYFAGRPRKSQLGAWASEQSTVIPDRQTLEAALEEVTRRFEGREVTRPPDWGGYRVVHRSVEFWQGQRSRLHDRIRYDRNSDGSWSRSRLSP